MVALKRSRSPVVIVMQIRDALRDLISFVKFKKDQSTHGGVLLLVKLQDKACNFNKSNIPVWVLFTFFKLCY